MQKKLTLLGASALGHSHHAIHGVSLAHRSPPHVLVHVVRGRAETAVHRAPLWFIGSRGLQALLGLATLAGGKPRGMSLPLHRGLQPMDARMQSRMRCLHLLDRHRRSCAGIRRPMQPGRHHCTTAGEARTGDSGSGAGGSAGTVLRRLALWDPFLAVRGLTMPSCACSTHHLAVSPAHAAQLRPRVLQHGTGITSTHDQGVGACMDKNSQTAHLGS